MRRRVEGFALTLAAFAFFILPARTSAQELVTGLSTDMISITSDFTGAELLVFGTVNNRQQLPATVSPLDDNRPYHVIIAVEGPRMVNTVRQKERIAGIWINGDHARLRSVPSSYLLTTSTLESAQKLDEILNRYKIGVADLSFGGIGNEGELVDRAEFREAAIRLKSSTGLYQTTSGVTFLADNLFSARFKIPSLIPVGIHTVRTFLFVDDQLIAKTSQQITINKRGFEQFLFDFSRQHGYIYGIFCAVLAMAAGWISSIIFRRD